MSTSSRCLDSHLSRRRTRTVSGPSVDAIDYSYFALATQNAPSYIAGGPPHPSIPGFSPVESPPPYLAAAYSPASPLKPAAPGVSTETMMMTQRDMGYGYMPSPMHNPLQYGPTGPSYSSLGPLPAYYSEPQQHHHHQRSYSGSSRPNSISVLDYQSLGADTGPNDMSMASRKRRRTSEHEARRLNKMRVRRSQVPGLLDQKNDDGSQMVNGAVDMYPAASTPTTYVPERPAMPSPYRHDYGDISPGQPQYSPPFHQPSYSMGPLTAGSLAPPLLPGGNSGYNPGRSSPLLHGPLPPASAVAPQAEPIVVGGGREKPQCWDHGCNGREFSTFSNLLRHQREKSGSASKSYCPHCGAEFTRTTARNGHVEQGKCKTRKTSDASNPPRP